MKISLPFSNCGQDSISFFFFFSFVIILNKMNCHPILPVYFCFGIQLIYLWTRDYGLEIEHFYQKRRQYGCIPLPKVIIEALCMF